MSLGKTLGMGLSRHEKMTQLSMGSNISIIQNGGKLFNIKFPAITFLFNFESNLDIRADVSLTNL